MCALVVNAGGKKYRINDFCLEPTSFQVLEEKLTKAGLITEAVDTKVTLPAQFDIPSTLHTHTHTHKPPPTATIACAIAGDDAPDVRAHRHRG